VEVEARKLRDYAWKNKRCTPHHQGEKFSLFDEYPKGSDPKEFRAIIKEISTKELSKL